MNYLAIIVVAIIQVILGSLWYSKVLFAKPWVKAMGPKMQEMMKKGNRMSPGMYFPPLIAAIVTSYVLAWFLLTLHITSFLGGAEIGFFAWLGFTTTAQVLNSWVFSDGKPKEVYIINTTYHLVSFVIMGAILAIWR